VGVAAVLAWQAREAWGDVQSALAITLARQQIRALVVGTGLPIAVVGVTYALVSGMTQSIPIGIGAAVGAGLLARTALSLVTRVRYRAGMRNPTDYPARRVVVEAAPLQTRDGVQEYVRINGDTELLHPHREQLLDDAAAVATALVSEDEDVEKPISAWHAQFAFDIGITDPNETEAKLVERPRKHLYTELRSNGGVSPSKRSSRRSATIRPSTSTGCSTARSTPAGTSRPAAITSSCGTTHTARDEVLTNKTGESAGDCWLRLRTGRAVLLVRA